ncbi:MAG TPA: nucleotide sugar dehydrogenase [Baekduia sp.]|nr:nucleotide sugar dehydrogenase [Baekduia sp.]
MTPPVASVAAPPSAAPTPRHLRLAPSPRTAQATVAILGLGYVGLPTALALADAGHDVLGVDISARRLEAIRQGAVDLLESDHERLARHIDGPLMVTDRPAVLADADAVLVCVPTPVDANHDPDLGPLRGAVRMVLDHVREGQLLVLTSTSYVGTTKEMLVEPLLEMGLTPGEDVFVAFAPERIDPGNVVHEQAGVPRVVGGVTDACTERAAELLGRISPVHAVSAPEVAELTKLHENTFRAVNIAYSYELAHAAQHFGIDPVEVIDAASTKPYGFMRFMPSAGVGGHCIPCDPHYLLKPLQRDGGQAPIIEAAMDAIARRPGRIVGRALGQLREDGIATAAARILVVGAAYKPGVADMRESPALDIIVGLQAAGAHVDYHDALVEEIEGVDGRMTSVEDPNAADYDLVVLCTVHPGTEPFWKDGAQRLLDCTYQAPAPEGARRLLP